MRIGQRVMLVGTDGFMPPMGAVGIIVGPLDDFGDHEVEFPRHPCPVAEPTWEIPVRWLMPLDDDGWGSSLVACEAYQQEQRERNRALRHLVDSLPIRRDGR